jgi:hypothetical protein
MSDAEQPPAPEAVDDDDVVDGQPIPADEPLGLPPLQVPDAVLGDEGDEGAEDGG